jgi:hypothetical protein
LQLITFAMTLPHSRGYTWPTKKRTPIFRVYEEIRLRFSSVLCCQPVSVDQAYRVNRYGFLWCQPPYAHHSTMATKKMNFNLCFRQGRAFSATLA